MLGVLNNCTQEWYRKEQTVGRLCRADADLHASFTLQSHLCALSVPSTCHHCLTVVKPGHFLPEHTTYQSSISLPHYHLTVKGLRRRVGRKRGERGWREVISQCHDMTLCPWNKLSEFCDAPLPADKPPTGGESRLTALKTTHYVAVFLCCHAENGFVYHSTGGSTRAAE